MKQNCKWIAALFTAASATLAFGCGFGGCGYTSDQLSPVGERVIYTQNYTSQPSAGDVIGGVVSAPFRLVGGAFSWMGQPSSLEPVGERVIVRRTFVEPVGERVIVHRTFVEPVGERIITSSCNSCNSCSSCMPQYGTTLRVMRQPAILQPVGERFVTTTKIIRYQPMLQPVGERFVTTKVIHYGKVLAPVGEKCKLSTKDIKHHGKKVMLKKVTYSHQMLQPVAEKTIIRTHKVFLKPVSQRIWTTPSFGCGCR
jgi:hypothetical protein